MKPQFEIKDINIINDILASDVYDSVKIKSHRILF